MTMIEEIIPVLYEKTQADRLDWKLNNESRVDITIGDMFIEIVEYTTGAFYTFTIRNRNGVSISSLNVQPTDSLFGYVSNLFNLVKRKALGVDEALTALKDKLDKL